MGRNLYICNSAYQILVAMWIKYTEQRNVPADIIISDHMNGGKELVDRLNQANLFEHAFYVESMDFSRFRIKHSRRDLSMMSLLPERYLKRFVKLKETYTALYAANLDFFTSLVLDVLSHKNPRVKFFIYEDGMFTYSKLFEQDYESTFIPVHGFVKRFIHSVVYRKRIIYGNVEAIKVFNPNNLSWNPSFPVKAISKISCSDLMFKQLCNQVFNYYNNYDLYDKKYIFLEESFFAEGCPINDVEVIEAFSEIVGKENIMVKIHPRNPINRFKQLGYKTNNNISIPWEVVLMNMQDISDKVLITVSSSAVLNPILILGMNIQARSIYNCINYQEWQSRLLSGEMWEVTSSIFRRYSNMVRICHKIEDIV